MLETHACASEVGAGTLQAGMAVAKSAGAQADKAGALKALEAAASKLTEPEEVAHGKLYVKVASKALEKVRGDCYQDLLDKAQVYKCLADWLLIHPHYCRTASL